MTPKYRHMLWITATAVASFLLLRSLPDTHCAFMHADHQPVVMEGVEFCGENEEANFYDPVELRFPFTLKVEPRANLTGGSLRLLNEDGRDVMPHDLAISHTRQLHLHLREARAGGAYLHLHPVAQPDGTWAFDFPPAFAKGFTGGAFEIYADFKHARSRRTILLSAEAEWPSMPAGTTSRPQDLAVSLVEPQPLRSGQSALLRTALRRPDGQPVVLAPLMGALGHAVLVSDDGRRGYAHMHPSWTGRERGEVPELAFRLRLPAAGRYSLWVHVDDAGTERYAAIPLVVSE